jgi:Flp pilus assembly protein TadG
VSDPRNRNHANRRHERGLGLVIVAIVIVVLFGFIGLAMDSGYVQSGAQQLQSAADAAALAGANRIHAEAQSGGSGGTYPVTRQAAVDVAAENLAAGDGVLLDLNTGNTEAGDVVVGRWDSDTGTFTATTSSPNAVKVVARRTGSSQGGALDLFFGGLFGAGTSDVSRTSIAAVKSTPYPYVIVLDPSASAALKLGGSAVLDVGDGAVQVNSSDACALKVTGAAAMSATTTSVHGNACANSGAVQGDLAVNADVYPDPFADVLPTTSDWNAVKTSMSKPLGGAGKISSNGTYDPGYYPKGMDLSSSTAVTLRPGTYMFGTLWSQVGGSSVTGSGVTILMDQNATIDIGGGASLVLSPPTSGTYEGLTIMLHRNTTSGSACTIGGNGLIAFEGTLYSPSGTVHVGGTGDSQLFGQIVCDQLEIHGNGEMTGEGVKTPSEGGSIYLVH